MFSDQLKRYRNELGLTQRELGKKLDVSKATIGQLETGLKEPSKVLLEKIYEFSGKNMNWWLGSNEQLKYSQTFKATFYPANKYKAVFKLLFLAIFVVLLIFLLMDSPITLEVCIAFIGVPIFLVCTGYYAVLTYCLLKNKIYITIEEDYIKIKKIFTTKRVNIEDITQIRINLRSKSSPSMVVIKCINSTKYYYYDFYFPLSWFDKKDINIMIDNLVRINENIWVIGQRCIQE